MSDAVNPNGTYYGPVGETPDEIFLEKTFLIAGYISGVGFGAQFILYLACIKALWDRKPRNRFTWILLVYISLLNAMNTIWTGTSAYGLQLTYIDNRNYPGGILAFLGVEFSLPPNVLSLAALVAGNILADALLLWRCQVIWTASMGRKANYFMILPGLMLLANIAMASLYGYETASPTAGLFSQSSINFALPYFAISLSLNIVLTIMIVAVMLGRKRRGREIFGDTYGKHYTSVSTMFIESAAIYSIISILLLPTYAVQHPIYQIWFGLAPAIQMIASYLIIYRVIQGRAWSTDTFAKTGNPGSTIAFSSGYGNSATRVNGSHLASSNTIPLHSLPNDSKSGRVQIVTTTQTQTDGDKDSMEWKKEDV